MAPSILPPLPPTPRQVMNEGFPELHRTFEDMVPQPRELIPNKEEAVEGFKDFAVSTLPTPKSVAMLGREMTESTVMDKVTTVAIIATPPAILIGALIVGGLILMGGGAAGAGAGAGGAGGALVPPPIGG